MDSWIPLLHACASQDSDSRDGSTRTSSVLRKDDLENATTGFAESPGVFCSLYPWRKSSLDNAKGEEIQTDTGILEVQACDPR